MKSFFYFVALINFSRNLSIFYFIWAPSLTFPNIGSKLFFSQSSSLGWHQFSFLISYWSSVSHGSCFYFFQNFYIFTNIFNQHFCETRSNPNKLFVYLKDDWMFSQHWATCWWHRPSVGWTISAAGVSSRVLTIRHQLAATALILPSDTWEYVM